MCDFVDVFSVAEMPLVGSLMFGLAYRKRSGERKISGFIYRCISKGLISICHSDWQTIVVVIV